VCFPSRETKGAQQGEPTRAALVSHTEESMGAVVPVSFTAGDGVRWTVRELTMSGLEPPDTPCLVFDSDSIIRRVRTYPADWRDLDATSLLTLSWKV
jgi:hypothetical protein